MLFNVTMVSTALAMETLTDPLTISKVVTYVPEVINVSLEMKKDVIWDHTRSEKDKAYVLNVLLVTCVKTSPPLHFQANVQLGNIVKQVAKQKVSVKSEHLVK